MVRVFLNAIRVFFSIIAVDIFSFILLLLMVVGDEPVPPLAKYVYNFFKWFCGFPLVLIDGKMPFFLDETHQPSNTFILIIANILLQTIIVLFLYYIVKSIINRTLGKK